MSFAGPPISAFVRFAHFANGQAVEIVDQDAVARDVMHLETIQELRIARSVAPVKCLEW